MGAQSRSAADAGRYALTQASPRSNPARCDPFRHERRQHLLPGSSGWRRRLLGTCLALGLILQLDHSAAAAEPATDPLPAPAQEAAEAVPATTRAGPTAEPETAPIEDLVTYLTAVDLHLQDDPALAAAYTTFWSGVRTLAADDQLPGRATPETFATVVTGSRDVITAVREHYRGRTAGESAAETLRIALSVLARNRDDAQAQTLLAHIDQAVAPLVQVNGRYEFAGDLARPGDLGFGTEVWMLCRSAPGCSEAHDALFADAMAGVGLAESARKRIERDVTLAASARLTPLLDAASEMDRRLRTVRDDVTTTRRLLDQTARDAWRQVDGLLQAAVTQIQGGGPVTVTPGTATTLHVAPAEATDEPGRAVNANALTTADRLDALVTMGQASAWLSGSEALANAFSVTRRPLIEFGSTLAEGTLLTAAAPGVASVGLVLAGIQALALFDGRTTEVPPEGLRDLVLRLNETTWTGMQELRAEQRLASGLLETRVAALGAAIEVVRSDVARLESASRRRIVSDYQVAAARRWSTFDEYDERCFGPRNRNPADGQLGKSDFRRCEDQFLQSAVRRSRYATRAGEYVLDPRFIDAADPLFPFHDHYPLLLIASGMDRRAALALPDPLDWQQNAAALLRLYRDHPATGTEPRRRNQVLATLAAAGESIQDALRDLTGPTDAAGLLHVDTEQIRRAIDAYLLTLSELAAYVDARDDPGLHPYGKRLTESLDQAVPDGARRSMIAAALPRLLRNGARIGTCADSPDAAFSVPPDALQQGSERFLGRLFADPIEPGELAAAWNRRRLDTLALPGGDSIDLIPGPYLWAALEGLGQLDVCLAQFRPEAIAFGREPGPVSDTRLGTMIAGAELEVRFLPAPVVPGAPERTAGGAGNAPPVTSHTIARYSADRACTFGYQDDPGPCQRGNCLAELIPQLWSDSDRGPTDRVRCEGLPMLARFPQRAARAGQTLALPLRGELEQAWNTASQPARARLFDDALRSDAHERAAAAYLTLQALTGLNLRPYTLRAPGASDTAPDAVAALVDPADPARGLTPRAVLAALLSDTVWSDGSATGQQDRVRRMLAAQGALLHEGVAARIAAIEATGTAARAPHLQSLAATLAHIDLARAALGGD